MGPIVLESSEIESRLLQLCAEVRGHSDDHREFAQWLLDSLEEEVLARRVLAASPFDAKEFLRGQPFKRDSNTTTFQPAKPAPVTKKRAFSKPKLEFPTNVYPIDGPEGLRGALMTAVGDYPGTTANNIVDMLKGCSNTRQAYAVIFELIRCKRLTEKKQKGRNYTRLFIAEPTGAELQGEWLTWIQLEQHPLNKEHHCLSREGIKKRVLKLGMTAEQALSTARTERGNNALKVRLRSVADSAVSVAD